MSTTDDLISTGRAMAAYFGPDLANNPIPQQVITELVDGIERLRRVGDELVELAQRLSYSPELSYEELIAIEDEDVLQIELLRKSLQ